MNNKKHIKYFHKDSCYTHCCKHPAQSCPSSVPDRMPLPLCCYPSPPQSGETAPFPRTFTIHSSYFSLHLPSSLPTTGISRLNLFPLNGFLRERTVTFQFSSVAQSCPTLCDPMDCSTPGLPLHHQLPELTQTHVHRVGDAIQPSHLLLSPSPPAFNLSQYRGLFQRVSSLHQVPKVLEFQLQHQSFQ